mgnify:CR=1 FL=1
MQTPTLIADPAAISNRQILPVSIPCCQVLIEEELGQNPESGEGWTEYNFQAAMCMHDRMSHSCLNKLEDMDTEQAARLPKETYALGIVELDFSSDTVCSISIHIKVLDNF